MLIPMSTGLVQGVAVVSFSHWRALFNNNIPVSFAPAIFDAQFRDNVGGSDLTSVATSGSSEPISSSFRSGFEPWRAFDSNTNSSGWGPNAGSITGQWVGWNFSSQVSVLEVYLKKDANGAYATNISIQGSNDGSSWETVFENSSVSWVSNEATISA